MIIRTFKVEEACTYGCYNDSCQHLPEYIDYIARQSLWQGEHYWIKKDTICAEISIGGDDGLFHREYYCRGCIPEIYQMVKTKLDPNLFAFH